MDADFLAFHGMMGTPTLNLFHQSLTPKMSSIKDQNLKYCENVYEKLDRSVDTKMGVQNFGEQTTASEKPKKSKNSFLIDDLLHKSPEELKLTDFSNDLKISIIDSCINSAVPKSSFLHPFEGLFNGHYCGGVCMPENGVPERSMSSHMLEDRRTFENALNNGRIDFMRGCGVCTAGNLNEYKTSRGNRFAETGKIVQKYGERVVNQGIFTPIKQTFVQSEPKAHHRVEEENLQSSTKISDDIKVADDAAGYQCERCGKVFSYEYYREKHLKYTRCVDKGDRKFPCTLCARSFEKRDRLRIHVLHVHEKHRPHCCSICGKRFSQSSSLNKHLRVHSGSRPYHCPYCTKAFTASSILRTHIRQHSGERPFQCKHCGKAFASHAAHDSHVRRTHMQTKLENHACNLCEKTFQHGSHLKFHVQCVHASLKSNLVEE